MLQVYKLNKTYGCTAALADVTFDLFRGETLAVMGPSGCGKSTLLRALHRLIPVDAGEIWLDGKPVMDLEGEALRRYRRRIGFVFQHQNLIDHLTTIENVALGPVMAGASKRRAAALAAAALERVGLIDKAQAPPRTLSGGERQRAGIARALVMDPDVILWDEPTAALDPVMVEEVLRIMSDLAGTGDKAMVVVTHEMQFALEIADRVLLMERGRVADVGPPQDVLLKGRTALGRAYRGLYRARYGGGRSPGAAVGGRKAAQASRSVPQRTESITRLIGRRREGASP